MYQITYEYAIELSTSRFYNPEVVEVYGTIEECHAQLVEMGYDPSDWKLVDCIEE